MFEHFDKPQDLFAFRLGSALAMENDSLQMLNDLEEAARSADVKELFHHHAGETREQIENLYQVFDILGLSPTDQPSPTTKGLAKEGHSLLRKSADALRDDVAVSAALGTEHYEIAAYQNLVATATTMHSPQVVHLLSANLEQEQHTSEELTAKAKELARAAAHADI